MRVGRPAGRDDIGAIGFNMWGMFVSDFGLVQPKSEHCKRSDLTARHERASTVARLVTSAYLRTARPIISPRHDGLEIG